MDSSTNIHGFHEHMPDDAQIINPDPVNSIRPPISFDALIKEYPNALSPEFCRDCIRRFNQDTRQYKGTVGAGLRLRTKQSTDLHISRLPGWEDVDKEFFNNLQPRLKSYTEEFDNSFRLGSVNDWLSDTGYQIQRTEPGGFYDWHSDFSTSLDENSVTGVKSRYYTYIWYLNTIEECGWTEFRSGVKIKPEEGKLLIFPAAWPFTHRGYPPKTEKYIATGWVYSHDSP